MRAALGCSDRGHTAVSQLKPGDIDWDELFGRPRRALVPHRRHLLRALGDPRHSSRRQRWKPPGGTARVMSYDLNYRESLWKAVGGQARAREVNRSSRRSWT